MKSPEASEVHSGTSGPMPSQGAGKSSEPSAWPNRVSMPASMGAKATVKKIAVSIIDPNSEPSSGGRNQEGLARRRANTEMSSNCPTRNAVAEAMAMRCVVAAPPSGFQGRGL